MKKISISAAHSCPLRKSVKQLNSALNLVDSSSSKKKQTELIRQAVSCDAIFENYTFTFTTDIKQIANEWQKAAQNSTILHHFSYQNTLNTAPPKGMQLVYVLFYKKKAPVGVLPIQITRFNAAESLNDEKVKTENTKKICPSFFNAIAQSMRQRITKKVDFYTMVLGNLLLTGEYSHYFTSDIPQSKTIELIDEAIPNIKKSIQKALNIKVSVVLFKEFYTQQEQLTQIGYHEFKIQPTMELGIRPSWNTLDDYKADMSSKYRVRLKRARKKGKELERKSLSLADLKEKKAQLYQLYLNIANTAGFNAVNLNIDYLTTLKEQLKESFQVYAYYLNDELVAFYSTMLDGEELYAHSIGFQPNLNRSHQVYLNMLYDMVDLAINQPVKNLLLGRTALEIKSSIGAAPKDMYCYMKHNTLSPKILGVLLRYLYEETSWKQRHPFKAVESA